jgi:hypothetical protein
MANQEKTEDTHIEVANQSTASTEHDMSISKVTGGSTEEAIIKQLETAGEEIGFTWRTLLGCIVCLLPPFLLFNP